MYRRIAVPLDVTKESQTALHWAVTIARLAGCPLDLVSVAFPPIYGSELYGASVVGAAEIDEMVRDAEQRLRQLAREVEALGIRVHATVLQGTVPSTLSDHVHSTGADLVVMTTHDRGRLESLLLGSVSHSVIRHVNVPVLLVHEGQGEPPPITTLATVSHVLVPLDGSPFGAQILPHAATLAELMHADVTLLGVLQPTLAVAAVSPGLGAPPDVPQPQLAAIDVGSEEERVELQREPLERTAASLRARDLSVHVRVLVDGQPAHAIVDYAKRHGTDLIAMTTHGHGALKRLVAGSVSESVLRAAPTPMLMYRPEHPA
jgi:nucleotide-binding universal stress UspA family protein